MLKTQGKRLREHMEELGKIGAAPEGGVNRFTYSKEYYESVELVRRYMLLIGYLHSIKSMHRLIQEIQLNIAYL